MKNETCKLSFALANPCYIWLCKSVTISGNKMEKSNYKEWSVDFNGKTIQVSNWWNWEGWVQDLYLDNEHLDQNTDMLES